jgi:hypothetical protein
MTGGQPVIITDVPRFKTVARFIKYPEGHPGMLLLL